MAFALSDQSRELEPQLAAALSALGMAAKADQVRRLLAYLSLLQRWNAVHNLSAAREPAELLQQHVVDCLASVGPLRRHAEGRPLAILDAGTGGGLPAVVLAIMQSDWDVTAVDAVGKKIAFLRQVAGELELANLHPRHARLESLSPSDGLFNVVTSRAYGSLRQFVETTRHVIDPAAVWVAMKASPSAAEIHELPADCQLFHVEPLSVPGVAAQRCLVWLKPTKEPRTS